MLDDDNVSAEVRAAEQVVDRAYLSNPLLKRPFAEAAWFFLAFCEEHFMRQIYRSLRAGQPPAKHDETALADVVMNHAKWPLRWILASCQQGGKPPSKYDPDMYQASHELSDLGFEYLTFESAFTYASLGLISLKIEGNRIVPSTEIRSDSPYEAYDHIADLEELQQLADEAVPFLRKVGDQVRVKDDWFFYSLNPRLVKDGLDAVGSYLENRFTLPEDWSLTRYKIGEFSRVAKTLWILSLIHFSARVAAATRGCSAMGYSRALLLMGDEELHLRVIRYSELDALRVKEILGDLTYGSRGIVNPDIALQPIVPLTPKLLGIAPNLIIGNSLERNLMVLMNRLPDERAVYAKLSTYREQLLRERIEKGLSECGWRFWTGSVSQWKGALDIDLAIISDQERRCLLLELKSFLAPADPREMRDKSLEIGRGIEQVRIRKELTINQPLPLQEALHIDERYANSWAVVSETSVGGGWVQAEDVAVLRASHLISHLVVSKSLAETDAWLRNRDYLPVEGKHYRRIDTDITIAGWTLNWYGIEVLDESSPMNDNGAV